MPDLNYNPYNRLNDFIDTGGVTGKNIAPAAPAPIDVGTAPQVNFMDGLSVLFNKKQPLKNEFPYSTPIRTPLQDTLRYTDSTYGYDPFNPNLEYQYGDRQSGWSKWGNNLLKFGANAAGAITESVVAMPSTLAAIAAGDISKSYNNDLTNSISEWVDNLETKLPNYETTFEKDHPILSYIPGFASLGTLGDTWGGVVKNLGYTAGSIAGALLLDAGIGALTAGVGEAPLIAPQIMKAFGRFGKVFSSAKTAEAIFKGAQTTTLAEGVTRGTTLVNAIDKAAQAKNIINKFRYGTALTTSVMSESIIEANQTYNTIKTDLTDRFFQQTGRDPNQQERENIEEHARGGGNADLYANAALLFFTESAVLGNVFRPAEMARKAVSKELTRTLPIELAKGSRDVFKQVEKNAKGFDLIANKVAGAARPLRVMSFEGFQEGSQFWFQRSAEDYHRRKFDNPEEPNTFMLSLATGLRDTFNTKEGLENIFMGALAGGLIHVGNRLNERVRGIPNNRQALVQSSLTWLNSERLSGLFENTYDEAITANSIANDMQAAAQQGDIYEYKNLQHQHLFNYINSGIKANRFDLRIDQLNSLKDMGQKEFEDMFKIPYTDQNRRVASAYVDSVIEKSYEIKSNVDKVNELFPNPFPARSKDVKTATNYLGFNDYKEQLSLDLSSIKDNQRRLAQINGDLSKLVPLVDQDKLRKLTSTQGLQETVESFEQRVEDINKSLELFADKKHSPEYTNYQVEKAWLETRIKEINNHLEKTDQPHYLKLAEEIINYHINGATGNQRVSPVDVPIALGLAQDSFKLLNSTDRALYHYQRLVSQNGFDDFMAKAVQARDAAAQKFENSEIGQRILGTAPVVPASAPVTGVSAPASNVVVDKNGNVTTVPDKSEDTKKELGILGFLLGLQNKAGLSGWTGAEDYVKNVLGIDPKTADGLKEIKEAAQARYDSFQTPEDKIRAIEEKKKADLVNIKAETKGGKTVYTSPDGKIRSEDLKNVQENITRKYDAEIKKATPEEDGASQLAMTEDEFTQLYATPFEDSDKAPAQKDKEQKESESDKGKSDMFYSFSPIQKYNQLYIPNKAGLPYDKALRGALFSQSPQALYDKLTIKVVESTEGMSHTKYEKFPGYPNVFYRGNEHDIELQVNGVTIGFIQPASRHSFLRDGKQVSMTEILPQEYEQVTRNAPETYNDFITDVKAYQAAVDKIMKGFAAGKTVFSNEEVKIIFDVVSNYGVGDYSRQESTSTLIKDLKYKTKGDAILSIPMIYNKDTGVDTRTDEPEVLNEADMSQQDWDKLWEYIGDNIEAIQKLNSRYVYVSQLPNGTYGKYSLFAARPAQLEKGVLDTIFETIKSVQPGDVASSIRRANLLIKDNLYIASSKDSKGNKTNVGLVFNEKGGLYMTVINTKSNARKAYQIPTEGLRNIDDLINEMQNVVAKNYKTLEPFGVKIDKEAFKNSVLGDEYAGMKEVQSRIKVSVKPNVFKDYRLFMMPKGSVQAETKLAPVTVPKATEAQVAEDKSKLQKELEDLNKKEAAEIVALPDNVDTEEVSSKYDEKREELQTAIEAAAAAINEEDNAAQIAVNPALALEKPIIEVQAEEMLPEGSTAETMKRFFEENTETLNKQGAFEYTGNIKKGEKLKWYKRGPFEFTGKTLWRGGRWMLQIHGEENGKEFSTYAAENQLQFANTGQDLPVSDTPLKAAKEDYIEFEEEIETEPEPVIIKDYVKDEQVVYKGKNYKVEEVQETAGGSKLYVITDGTKYGSRPVRGEDLQKIEQVTTVAPEIVDTKVVSERENKTQNTRYSSQELAKQQPKTEAEVVSTVVIAADVKIQNSKEEEGIKEIVYNGKVIGRMYYDRSMMNSWQNADYSPTKPSDHDTLGDTKEQAIQTVIDRYNEQNKPIQPEVVAEKPKQSAEDIEINRRLTQEEEAIAGYRQERTTRGKDEGNTNLDYVGLKLLLNRLQYQFSLPYKIVQDEGAWKGRFNKGIVEINLNNFDRTTPFHEYLHPFIAVMKSINQPLYRNLVTEISGNKYGQALIAEVKKSPFYKGKTAEEIGDEALVRYISKAAAKNVNAQGQRTVNKYFKAVRKLLTDFRDWFTNIIQGISWKGKGQPVGKVNDKNVYRSTDNIGQTQLDLIPETMSLNDIADLVSISDIKVDMVGQADVVNALEAYQADIDNLASQELLINKLRKTVGILEASGKKRVPSEVLVNNVIQIRTLLKNADEVDSLDRYLATAMRGLQYASSEFRKISGKVKNPEQPLTDADVLEFSRGMYVVKTLMAFYKDDANHILKHLAKKLDDGEYKDYLQIIANADIVETSIQNRSIDILTEWLYPYVEKTNPKGGKFAEYVVSKEAFKKQLRTAASDVDSLHFLFGGISASKDVVSSATFVALKGLFEDASTEAHTMNIDTKLAFDKFLKSTGLSNERNALEKHFKENYLRKATLQQKVAEDEEGKPIYGYTDHWAYHEKYMKDLYERDLNTYLESIKFDDKNPEHAELVNKWVTDHTVLEDNTLVPADNYLNPKFEALYGKDEFFTKMYDYYTKVNSQLGEDERLKFGIVQQVSKGKNLFADYKWNTPLQNVKTFGNKVLNFFLPADEQQKRINEEAKKLQKEKEQKLGELQKQNLSPEELTARTEELEELYQAKIGSLAGNDNVEKNLDGSYYRNINTPHVRLLDESDLDLALPETLIKFYDTTTKTLKLRETEPNVSLLKSLIESGAKYTNDLRKVLKVTSKGNVIFDNKRLATKEDSKNKLNKQLNHFIDNVVYGDTEDKATMNLLGLRQIDLNKFAQNWSFFTSANAMAGNVTATIANVAIGEINSFSEALGGKYWTPKDWAKATGAYGASIPEFFADATRFKKSLITQLGIKYDAIQGEFRDKYGKKLIGNVAQRYATGDTIFILTHMAEHEIQLKGMLALMMHTQVKTTDGRTISLYDAHELNKEGYLRLKKDVIWTAQDEKNFTSRLHGINEYLNGLYNQFNKSYAQRKWYGKAALIFRKHFYNSLKARWGNGYYDRQIQDKMSGFYKDFFTKFAKDVQAYKGEAITRLFTKKGWNEEERYAWNRTTFELSLFTAVSILALIIARGESDDDKDKPWGQEYLNLLMVRLRSDLGQFNLVGAIPEFANIAKNPSVLVGTLNKLSAFSGQLVFNPFETYKRKTGAFDKGDSILYAKFSKLIPFYNQWLKLKTPKEQAQFYNLINKN